jgi:hypothetical protein
MNLDMSALSDPYRSANSSVAVTKSNDNELVIRRLRKLRASFGDMRRSKPIPSCMTDPGSVLRQRSYWSRPSPLSDSPPTCSHHTSTSGAYLLGPLVLHVYSLRCSLPPRPLLEALHPWVTPRLVSRGRSRRVFEPRNRESESGR